MNDFHDPVLLTESISALKVKKNGVYVDATFGGGGHSNEILKKLSKDGKLIVFDLDEEAIKKNKIIDDRVITMNKNFRYIKNCINSLGLFKIDGILVDLGVSSFQINKERGFSFKSNTDLDMRMNQSASFSAIEILNNYDEESISRILKEHADFSNSKKLAQKIILYREKNKITSTEDIEKIFKGVYYVPKKNQFFARIFQAIRIEVNDELNSLKDLLKSSLNLLNPHSRLVVISYHSIEDRIVKTFMKFGHFKSYPKKDFYGNQFRPFTLINKKPIIPSDNEIRLNNRARSAKMRIAEFVTNLEN
jgi:16S rRNA (cytosine1402-N4)-methyltransferase